MGNDRRVGTSLIFCTGDFDSAREGTKVTKKERKTNLGEGDGRVPEEEELVYGRNDDSQQQADDPSTECRRRYGGIVGVGYRGPDFGIRGFIFECDGSRVKVGVVEVDLQFSPSVLRDVRSKAGERERKRELTCTMLPYCCPWECFSKSNNDPFTPSNDIG